MTTKYEVRCVLESALSSFDDGRLWRQGRYYDSEEGRCAFGALVLVTGYSCRVNEAVYDRATGNCLVYADRYADGFKVRKESEGAFSRAVQVLNAEARKRGARCMSDFNDKPGRTWEDVKGLYVSAIDSLRPKHRVRRFLARLFGRTPKESVRASRAERAVRAEPHA